MKRSLFLNLFISLSIGLITIGTVGAATLVPITACTGCHGTDPLTNQAPIEGSQRNVPPRAIVGSHATHNSSLTCSGCHVMPATLNHMDMNINMSATISGGTYSKSQSFPVSNSPVGGECNSTACHGQKSPAWTGGSVSTTTCTKCHGQPNAVYLTNYTSAVIAPGTGTTGRDTAGNTAATAPRVGAHKAHMEGSVVTGGDISRTIRCRECHTPHPTVADAGHLNRSTATITFGSIAQSNGHTTANVTRTGGIITCNNTYCHTGKLNTGAAMTPTWNATTYLSSSMTMTDCKQCHNMPPNPGVADHSGIATALTAFPVGAACNCHNNLSQSGTTYANIFANKAIHVDGKIDAAGSHTPIYPGATHMNAVGATVPATNCGCHNYQTAGVYPTSGGAAPACMGCHLSGLLRTVATSSCWDCHGSGPAATQAWPNGTVFPNNNRSHTAHTAFTGITCAACHNGSGTGTAGHGGSNRTAHTVADVNVVLGALAGTSATWATGPETCASSNCHGQRSPAWGVTASTTQCTKCHGQPNAAYLTNYSSAVIAPGTGTTGRDTGGNTAATAARVGSHKAHMEGSVVTGGDISRTIRCRECHTPHPTVNDATHLNRTTATVTFGPIAQSNSHTTAATTRTGGVITCNNTYCHSGKLNTGAAMAPAWNSTAYLSGSMTMTDCKQCHNMPPLPGAAGAHSGIPSALTAFPVNTTCSCHSNLSQSGTTYANIFTNKALHVNGIIESSSHPFPYTGGSPQHKIDAGTTWTACSGCHTTTGTGTLTAYQTWVTTGHPTKVAPACNVCHIGGLANNSCSQCHGAAVDNGTALAGMPGVAGSNVFPNISGSHRVHMTKVASTTCAGVNSCHSGFGTGSTHHGFMNTTTSTKAKMAQITQPNGRLGFAGTYAAVTWTPATNSCANTCHGSGAVWGGTLKCIDCHASAMTTSTATRALDATVTTRAAVVGEFTNTWSHKRSFTGTPKVVDADCIACHMEGVKGAGTSAVHGDGYVNLRDPDTGANITNVTFGGTGAGAYTAGTTPVQFVRFKRDYSKRLELDPQWLIIAAVQQNHCLKCHDTAGATNVNAQVPTTGTALKPFGVTITGHAAPFDSNGNGNVVDVNKSFLTTNSSYHPVRGKQNNWFAKYSGATTTANMISPWKGPFATRGATVNATAWGNLLSCWDCHAPAGTVSTSGVVTRSVTAHGAAATLRAPIRAAGTTATTNLCLACHKVGYSVSTAHGTNTAFTAGASNMNAATFSNCSFCHAYAPAGGTHQATTTLRPLRGEDAHGFNDRTAGTVGSRWTTSNTRPFGFVRNSLNPLIYRSVTASGDTIAGGTAGTCTGTAGTCGTDMGGDNYGGGTY